MVAVWPLKFTKLLSVNRSDAKIAPACRLLLLVEMEDGDDEELGILACYQSACSGK